MSKLLAAIPACHRHDYGGLENASRVTNNEALRMSALRDTWLKNCPADYRFFYGHGSGELKADEVQLDVPDDYEHLPHKIRESCRWALDHDYTHIYRVDNDSYVYMDRLLKSGFEDHDYTGYCLDYPYHLEMHGHRYATGGAGFILNRRAMQIVIANEPTHPAEDLWIGRLLHQHGIRCHRDTRYLPAHDLHFIDLNQLPQEHPYLALHALTPDSMKDLHARGYPGDDFTAPVKPLFEPDYPFGYGRKSKDCSCKYCNNGELNG